MTKDNDPELEKDIWGMTDEELDELDRQEEEKKNEGDITEGFREIVKLKQPDEVISKAQWDKIIQDNFPDLFPIAKIILASIGQLLIKDIVNPFGLILVDDAASGKTLALNFFAKVTELVYSDDNFTPASFVSHSVNRKREELGNIDLLPKIKDKVLLVREMAPIFGSGEDQLLSNMATLTRIFDGEGYERSSAVHGKRGYRGEYMFVFLGASTPIEPRVWKTMSKLGSRLFFVQVNSRVKDHDELANQVITPHQKKIKICQEATANLLRGIWNKHPDGVEWDPEKTKEKYIKQIAKIAILLARFRGSVLTWDVNEYGVLGLKNTKSIHTLPEVEHPDRIVQILYNFAQGKAVVNGRDYIDASDVRACLKIALESAPYMRTKLFKALIRNDGELDSATVESVLNQSRPIALRDMQKLAILKLVNESKYGEYDDNNRYVSQTRIKLKPEFSWLLEYKKKYPNLFR